MENANNKYVVKGGATLIELYQLAVIVLKLVGAIDWSWWLVLLPTFISAGIVAIILTAYIVLVLLKVRNDAKIERLKKRGYGKEIRLKNWS